MSTPTATPRTDDTPCQATPSAELRQQIMDSRVPKNEREWWAQRTIEKLETELAAAQSERDLAITRVASILWSGAIDKHTCGDVQKWVEDYIAELTRLRAELEVANHSIVSSLLYNTLKETNASLRAEVERLKELLRIESASAQHALAAAERAEAELDWLLDRSAQTYHSYSNHLGGGNYVQYHKDRAAIQAAMKEGK